MWALGALLAIFGSVATNFGVNVQKHSQNLNSKKPKLEQQFYYKQKLYLIGLALVILGSLGDFAALSMAAQSIVAPLGSVTLVTNIFFAKYFLKEQLGRKDLIGTIGIIIGSVLAVAFGDHSEVTYTVQELESFYGRGQFIAFAVVTILLALVGYIVVRYCNPLKQRLNDSFVKYDYLIRVQDAQLDGTVTSDIAHEPIITDEDIDYQNSIIECLELDYKRYERIHPFTLCALSGVCGGWSVMFGKMVAECLSTTFGGQSQLGQPVLYLFAICMLCTIMAQLNFLAIALGYFDALYCVPIFQCFWIMTSTFGGACYFNEFATFTAVQWVFFPLGIIVTVSGVVVLSTRNMTQRSSDTHLKHDSSMHVKHSHDVNSLDTLTEVDELEFDESLTEEEKLKFHLHKIQQNALHAAEALENNNNTLDLYNNDHNNTVEMSNVSIQINQYNTNIQQKLNQLQQQNEQPTPKSSIDINEESKESDATVPQSNVPAQSSPIRKFTDVSDYSPNSRIRQIQLDSVRHRRSRSGSGSPNWRKSIDLDPVNAPDTPLHRALSYVAGAYTASVGAVHSSDLEQTPTNTNSKPTTPNHIRMKSINLTEDTGNLA